MFLRICCFITASLILFTATGLFAQVASQGTADDTTETLRRASTMRDKIIQKLITRIEQLEKKVSQLEKNEKNVSRPEPATETEAGIAVSETFDNSMVQEDTEDTIKGSAANNTGLVLDEPDSKEQERLIRAAFEHTLIERGGLLLPPYTYAIESSFSYVHSSVDNILIDGFTVLPVLVVGDIVSQRVRRDQFLGAMSARLGLSWDSQVEFRVPYGYMKRRTYSADNEEEILSDSGFGDIELAFSHQFYKSWGEWPDLLTTLRWKSDTGDSPFTSDRGNIFLGTGYHSLNLSFAAVKVIDPVVYFGGINYSFNLATTESIGRYDPGDSYGFNLGMAIALNLSNSISFSYDQQFALHSELDGESISGSYLNTGVFSVGSSYTFTDYLTVDFSLGVGLTSDSPDVVISTAFPFRGKF